jgi:hypothetical protein
VDGAYTIFALLCIEMWCRLFVDGDWKKHAAPSSSQVFATTQSVS